MKALQIKDIKLFMNQLLNSTLFDSFLLEEAQIKSYNNFVIDGHMNLDFFTKEELEDPELFPYAYSTWKNMKPILFQLIKGKKVPTLLKITLLLTPEKSLTLLEASGNQHLSSSLKAFVATIKFDSQGLYITTGTSFTTFLMDQTADILWDQNFCQFLSDHGIDYSL